MFSSIEFTSQTITIDLLASQAWNVGLVSFSFFIVMWRYLIFLRLWITIWAALDHWREFLLLGLWVVIWRDEWLVAMETIVEVEWEGFKETSELLPLLIHVMAVLTMVYIFFNYTTNFDTLFPAVGRKT